MPRYRWTRTTIDDRTEHVRWSRDDHALTYGDAIAALCDDAEFRASLTAALLETRWHSYRWETPSLEATSIDRAFEFVCVASPELAAHADRRPFADHFIEHADVVAFANLGRDALLVVPCPRVEDDAYAHLGAFMRAAPDDQRHALWREVGTQMTARLGIANTNVSRAEDRAPRRVYSARASGPVWLSTAGAGVAWLHVRLDDRPKYYAHRPFVSDGASEP